jgi:hypothetical protein
VIAIDAYGQPPGINNVIIGTPGDHKGAQSTNNMAPIPISNYIPSLPVTKREYTPEPTNADQVNINTEIEIAQWEQKAYEEYRSKHGQSAFYSTAFEALSTLDPGNFKLKDAVYIVENAFYNNRLSKASFDSAVSRKAALVRKILRQQGLNAKNNLAVNYGIQQLYSPESSNPLSYRFDDFLGKEDYTNTFVTKLLATGKGQCHSMPMLYMILAEQLGAKAYVSFSPQHMFIRFKDDHGSLYNFETTSGHVVSNAWITQTGFITARALQNHTYFDTLSSPRLYAQILVDLLLGYMKKYPYDGFAETIRQKIISIDPDNLTALIIATNISRQIAEQELAAVGYPPEKDLIDYPAAFTAYNNFKALYGKIDNTGYQEMPPEEYQRWLQSIEKAKAKQEMKELNVQLHFKGQH